MLDRLLGAAEDPLLSEDEEEKNPPQQATEKQGGSGAKDGDVPTPTMSLDKIENELNNPIGSKAKERHESEP